MVAMLAGSMSFTTPTRADPAPADKATAPASSTDKPVKPAKKKAAKKKSAPNLRLKPTAKPTIDLFPLSILGPRTSRGNRFPETHPGHSLGDDSSWQTHAAQAGAMVAIFGGLAALCSSGACKIPKFLTDPIPDFFKSEPYPTTISPRAPQKIPNLR